MPVERLTPERIRAHLERLGLSQLALAAILHRNPKSVRRWCKIGGDVGPPRELELLLPLLTREACAKLLAAERE